MNMVNEQAFQEVYDSFHAKIFRYLKHLVGENEAEEVTQTVFERVSRNLGSFKRESKLSTWLYRIATNAALDKLKSSSYKHSPVGELAPFPIHSPEIESCVSSSSGNQVPPEKRVIREEMSECVREFIDRLPPDYRTIITLNEIEGFTNVEIAEILQISLDASKIRLHRARAKLKSNLEAGCDFYLDERSVLACDRKQSAKKQ